MALRLGWHNIHILYQFGLPYHNHSDAFYYLRYGLPWKNFWMNIIFLSFSFEPYIHSDLTKTMNWMNTYYSKTETHRKSIIAAAWRVQQHEVNFEQVHFRFLILWPVHLSASITSRMYMCSSLLGGDEAHFRFSVAPNAIFCTSLLPSPLSLRAHTVILCTVQVNGLDSGRIFIRYRKNTVYTCESHFSSHPWTPSRLNLSATVPVLAFMLTLELHSGQVNSNCQEVESAKNCCSS